MVTRANKTHAWLGFTVATLGVVMWVGLGWESLSLFADPVIKEFGLATRSQFMLIITIISTCNMAGSLIYFGHIIEKFGVKKTFLIGGLIATVGFLIMGLSQNIWMLYVGAAFYGIAIPLVNVNMMHLIIDRWFAAHRMGRLVGVSYTISSFAGIIFSALVVFWIAATGWRIVFFVMTAVSLIITILIWFLYKGDPKDLGEVRLYEDEIVPEPGKGGQSRTGEGIPYRKMFKSWRFYALIAMEVILGMLAYSIMSNLALFAIDLGYDNLSGTVLSVALAASVITMLPCGAIADKLRSAWMIAVCLAALIIGSIILMNHSMPLIVLYIAAVCSGIAYNIVCVPMGITTLETLGSSDFSKKLGAVNAGMFAGCSISPVFMSMFYDFGGQTYDMALIAVIVLAVIVGILAFPLTKRIRSEKTAEQVAEQAK